MKRTCPLCLRRYRGEDAYCSLSCEQRAAVPTTNDLMVTAGRASLVRSRAVRGVEQSGAALFGRNIAAIEETIQ